MRTAQTASIAILLAALGFTAPAHGQETCENTETVAGCYTRLRDAAANPASATTGGAGGEADELAKKATGPNVAENLAQSAIRDFLPRFAGTVLASDPTEGLRAVDFRFNTPLRRGGDRLGLTLQGGVTLHAAELYAPLVDSIPESIREASRERLKEELEDGDDATAFVTLNLESRTVGRNFSSHQAFVDTLATAIRDSANRIIGPQPKAVTTFLFDFSRRLGDTLSIEPTRRDDPECMDVTRNPKIPNDAAYLPVTCLTKEVRAEMETLLLPVARYMARRELTMESVLANSGFDLLADLINNQPQVNFSAEYNSRVGVVGPNEWAGRVRFETGFANMNGLRALCGQRVTLGCLDKYTDSIATPSRLRRGDRLWFEGEVRYRPEYHVELAADSVDFTLGSGVGFGVSGGYGRYLGSTERDDEDRDRIDLHLSYDHADGEDLRQSRFLAGVFYTLRISGSASGVVGLAWANKPEFVEGADRHLHANLGLSYKFNQEKKGN